MDECVAAALAVGSGDIAPAALGLNSALLTQDRTQPVSIFLRHNTGVEEEESRYRAWVLI